MFCATFVSSDPQIITMKSILLSTFLLLTSQFCFTQGFDAEKSYIEFKASNFWVNTVTGTIKGWEGEVDFDRSNPTQSSFDVSAKVKTINTGNEERDDHLRSDDFFNAEKYPEIRFESIRVTDLGEKGYMVIGNLTIRDVTSEVIMPFEIGENELRGQLTIDRHDFNVGVDQSNFSVGKEIDVTVVCVLK